MVVANVVVANVRVALSEFIGVDMFYLGKVYNGYGALVGGGLELDGDGKLVRVLTAREAENVRRSHSSGARESSVATDERAAVVEQKPVEQTLAPKQAPATGNPPETVPNAPEYAPPFVDGALITPGFVDIHCHGGGGFAFPDNFKPEEIETATSTHQRGGTTAMLASLVSLADPLPQIEALRPFCERGELAGLHFEGPYISQQKCGAQNPAVIRPVDVDELRSWLDACKGWMKTMTVAPEAQGAREAADLLLEYGAKPSWGHSNATGEEARAELDYVVEAHARTPRFPKGDVPQTVTHLFNAMPSIQHRAPGPIREFIQAGRREEIACEVIADGHHIHPDLVEDVIDYLDKNDAMGGIPHAFFVTDSLAAAGMPPGKYTLGGLAVEVRNGVCYLEGTTTISGGATVLADHFRLFARRGNLHIATLVRACVSGPVHAGSLEGLPGVTLEFEPGVAPNFIVFDEDFTTKHVVREGKDLT